MRALHQEHAMKTTNQYWLSIDMSVASPREHALVRPEFGCGERAFPDRGTSSRSGFRTQ
jgi:hypothetical protein